MKQNFFDFNCTPFVEFEETIQTQYLNPFYESKGWQIISREGNKDRDLVLCIGSKNYKVEEKIRNEDYGDLIIEIIQDVKDRNMGWLFKTSSEFIFYIVCIKKIPKKLFIINLGNLKDFIYKNKNYDYSLVVSFKGYGESWNISVPWGKLPKDIYKLFELNV